MDVFISGVGPLTTREEILTLMGEDRGADAERVAIGREARDTRGNAREVAQWLEERGHRRVIVVTSDFHMRRALWELTRARPDLAFIPHPAPSPDVAMARWWRDPKAFRRAASEFSKYAFVRLTAGAPS